MIVVTSSVNHVDVLFVFVLTCSFICAVINDQ